MKAAEIVKLHYVPGLPGAPLFVAVDKGFFDQAGIKVDLKPTTAVTEVVPFLSTGQIDVAMGGYGAGIFSVMNYGIYYDSSGTGSSGIYMNNLTSGCTTPFSGGTAAGSTNYHQP